MAAPTRDGRKPPTQLSADELRARTLKARRDRELAQKRLDELRQGVAALRQTLAQRDAEPRESEPAQLHELRSEVARLSEAVDASRRRVQQEEEHDVRDEHGAAQRALAACRKRVSRLKQALGELSEADVMERRREAIAKRQRALTALEAEKKELGRALKRVEQRINVDARERERDADISSSTWRTLRTECARLRKVCATAEELADALRDEVARARAALRMREQLLEATARAIEARIGEPAVTAALSAVREAARPGDPAAQSADEALTHAKGPRLVALLAQVHRRHGRLSSDLRRRRGMLRDERAKLEQLRERAAHHSVDLRALAGRDGDGDSAVRQGGEAGSASGATQATAASTGGGGVLLGR